MNTITCPIQINASPDADVIALLPDPAPRSDFELISLVRVEPPDEQALELLVDRYWAPLFARCKVLTSDPEKARDLAQSAWCRLLRNRSGLKPDGNFLAYLMMIATNLFRDSYRARQRAGMMADSQLEPLDAIRHEGDEDAFMLLDIVPDLKSLQPDAEALLALDLDEALELLTPQMRDVLVSRFFDGQSCNEIGARYGRTEQTINAWIRAGLRQMRAYLEESPHSDGLQGNSARSRTSNSGRSRCRILPHA